LHELAQIYTIDKFHKLVKIIFKLDSEKKKTF
jgi:hypothetical protein